MSPVDKFDSHKRRATKKGRQEKDQDTKLNKNLKYLEFDEDLAEDHDYLPYGEFEDM